MSQQPPRNLTNELAKERNRDAAERTLMAWIRTSLSLISFGFGIDKIVDAIERGGGRVNPVRATQILGLAFISVGVYASFMAILEHRQQLKLIQRDDYVYTSRRSYGLVVATSLVFIGAFAFIAVLLKSIA